MRGQHDFRRMGESAGWRDVKIAGRVRTCLQTLTARKHGERVGGLRLPCTEGIAGHAGPVPRLLPDSVEQSRKLRHQFVDKRACHATSSILSERSDENAIALP